MTSLDVLLAIHIAAGLAALASFWIPMVAPKGGRLHRRAGWVFVGGMAVVSATAIVLSGIRFVANGSPRDRIAAVLLAYVGVIVGAGAWKGMRVLRTKNRSARTQNPWDLVAAGAVLLLGPPTAVFGMTQHSILLSAFGILGTVIGAGDVRYWWRAPRERMHWWYEHMADMMGTCIAAITAFFVLNAGRMGLGTFSLVVWLGPAVVGFPALMIWQAHYRRRFTPKRSEGETQDSSIFIVRSV
jgi:uncharacterized membrane protein